jgi:ribonuclease Z
MHGAWQVCDIHPNHIETRRFELSEGFAVVHDEGTRPISGVIMEKDGFVVESLAMDHSTPSMAYVVREKPRQNIDVTRLQSAGLRPGPWLKQLKDIPVDQEFIEVQGNRLSVEVLRKTLLVETAGDTIAYLTDFLMDETAMRRLEPVLRECKVVVCESQYRHADLELAQRNFHMTCTLAAELARRANVGELVLFHLSDRYPPDVWTDMLQEARRVFPKTRFPGPWDLGRT